MVKSEIIRQLHEKHPALKRSQIEAIFNIMFDAISNSLIKEKPVELREFGRFSVKKIKAKYNARNPKTGEVIYIPEKKKVSFKMSKHLKQEINKEPNK
ncbi:integration host factor subunit beta [Pelagibacteraceae bacterium]|nr:integration host factor subunit beta [Pelagibacteraceae bacterium]